MDATKGAATQSKDTEIATEKYKDHNGDNKPLDLKIVKSGEKKHVSFENESVKKTDNSCDPFPPESKDSSVSSQVVTCAGGGGLSKYFTKKESDTDEYEEYDEMDDDGDSIPCSQMRDIPCMLQWQNACCNFDSAYMPLNLTHIDNTKGEESQEEKEDEENKEEEDTEENGSQEDGEDSNNGWVN